jgi:opacity protein-like surface antigen
MKTLYLIAVCVLVFLSVTHAQSIIGYGIKGGFAVANQNFDYSSFGVDTKSNRVGLSGSAFVELSGFKFISLLTEVNYIQKGMVEKQIITGEDSPEPLGTLELDNRVDYISIPILAKMTFRNKFLSPFITIGPRFDFLLSYKSENSFFDTIYEKFGALDIGGDFGAGTEYQISNPFVLLLELRYSHSYSDAYKTKLLSVKNNSYQFLFGLKF